MSKKAYSTPTAEIELFKLHTTIHTSNWEGPIFGLDSEEAEDLTEY